MAVSLRRGLMSGLVLALLTVCGCSPQSLYFIFGDTTNKPECEAFDSPKKEIKVVFLTYADTDMKPEFVRVDRDVSELLVRNLKKTYAENKDKIVIVPPGRVESFKDKNANWRVMSMKEVGDYFHADFVVSIEMSQMSLYEPKSQYELFRGLAQTRVSVVDTAKIEDGPVFTKEFTFKFPTQGARPVIETNNPGQFRSEFLAYMVKQISRCFIRFTIQDKYPCDQ